MTSQIHLQRRANYLAYLKAAYLERLPRIDEELRELEAQGIVAEVA